ncbi:MAG: CsgG/HfaB family protein [Thermodesulfobacteriota bacterium]
MRKRTHLFPLLLMFCASVLFVSDFGSENSFAFSEQQQAAAKIAILGVGDFVPDRTGLKSGGLPDGLAARVMERLSTSRRFTVMERTALRRVILEQRFGEKRPVSDVDRLMDKAITDLEKVRAGTLAVAGVIADKNDALRDFQDLGTAVGADYLVYAKLEKVQHSETTTEAPYSESGRKVTSLNVDARLYLRVVDVKNGRIAGAASIRTQLSESVFGGKTPTQDEFSIYDELGRQAAGKIIDMVFPARIVSSNPWVLNRGANDGVLVGDIYDISREGKEIKDSSGIVLDRIRTSVGKARLSQVQDTISVIDIIEGDVAENDLAELSVSATTGSSVATSAKVSLKQKVGGDNSVALPRVAVGLVKSGSTARTGEKASEHIPLFTDTIISRLTQTKRFQLIDRQEVDQLIDERMAQALAGNRDMPSAMGTLKGVDYMVYGSLASFSVEDKSVQLPGSGKTFKTKVGYVEGNMRIVDARSGDILESHKVSVTEKLDKNSKGKRLAALLADAYAEQVVLNLMSAVYPIKVAAIDSGAVYINRGGDGGLYVGETLIAYRPGQAVIDPDTGVQLGVTESLLGEVVVSEVEDARAKGHSTADLQVGDLLKRTSQNKGKRASITARSQPAVRSSADPSDTKATGKATLAVGKVQLNRRGKNDLLSGAAINRISNDLIVKLSQMKRFDVMERQEVDQILDEKAFTAGAGGEDIEASLRALVGADYLIHATVADFYINRTKSKVVALDEVQIINKGIVEATLRIVDVHTGKVVAANKIRISQRLSSNKDRRQVVNGLIDRFTSRMVGEIVSNLFPGEGDTMLKAASPPKKEKKLRKVNKPAF